MTIGRRLALAFSTILVLLAVNQAIQLWSASLRTASVAALNRALQRQIVLADVSMSVDNVLAVAGAAREHPAVMAADLLLSVVLMGIAASFSDATH